ncbi:MAG: Eco57I restriction-modification methylase domain-containing protein, partial [bacterium]
KAMGAYYTPEYIVDYIVQQTVRRGLEERRASLEDQLPGWLEEVETAPPGERRRLQRIVDQKLLDFVEEDVLTFRVCDPAMGSGHFLVNAVHTITTFIVETLNLTPWENAEIDSDPVTWRRRVAKRCLYGVDLNDLAVELAKLSLWLTTVAKSKPLSFLDHHLRQGNSLIGVRLEDLIELLDERADRPEEKLSAAQISMFDAYPDFRAHLKGAKRLLRRISARVADAAEDVESQMADYEQVRRELKPYRDLANLVTAQHFGVDVDDDQLHTVAHSLLEDTSRFSEDDRTLLARAREQARSRSFFHWDIEFPEVFVHLDRAATTEDRGFDAMVGNPPWDVLIDLRGRPELRQELDWYRTSDRYAKHLAGGRKNIYWFFCMLGVSLLGKTGHFSMIVPVTLLTDSTTRGLRKLFIEDHSMERLVQFPEAANVFGKVSQSCSIFVVSRGASSEEPIQVALGVTSEQLDELTFHSLSPDVIRRSSGEMLAIPMFLSEMVPTVLERIHKWDSLDSSMVVYQGEANQTFDSEHFLVQPSGTRLIRGTHVQKYEVLPPTRGNPDWIDASSFLQAASGFKQRMVQRTRVVTQGISNMALPDRLKAVIVEPGSVVGNSCNALIKKNAAAPVELTYVMALLNSTLLEWRYRLFSSNNNINTYELEALPLRPIASTTSEPTLLALADQGRQLCNESLNDADQDGALHFADQQLRAEPSRTDVVQRMLVYLADRAVQLRGLERDLDKQVDVFEYVGTDQPVLRLEKAFVLTKRRRADDVLNLEAVHHDIDGLHLVPTTDGTWTLELHAKLRDPDQGWQDWIKEEDSHMIKRRWVPAYRLQMNEEKARFYRYALPRLQDFDNASSFPGGYTRTTLKKLHLTKVPMMPDVDVSELARLDRELSETKRKIELTDDLIDQIVYKLYGLTEEEIAIVEGQA